MNRTPRLSKPLVTILSPSHLASRNAQSILNAVVGLEEVALNSFGDDALNKASPLSFAGLSRRWVSVASKCPSSGSIVHFCSLENASEKSCRESPFALLGVTDFRDDEGNERAIQGFRDLFAAHLKSQSFFSTIRSSMGGSAGLLASALTNGLPLLSLPPTQELSEPAQESGGLKEVVIPHYDYATYDDGSTLLGTMGKSMMTRPAVGVYQWVGSTTRIRPLPTAAEDQRLPPPSLIFHCQNPEDINVEQHGAQSAKIGYGGTGRGQLMVLHKDLIGLDVRFCPQLKVSSAFSEAQESLLAGALDDLQSTNTLLTGDETAKEDEKIGKADCWVELRANLKQPKGYLDRSRTSAMPRRAKAPDLPFE